MLNTNNHPFFEGYNFLGFVHRGGAEEATENTLEAFQHASDIGFVFMETDVQATLDGEVVIFHDSNLERVAGINKKISQLSYKEIKKIDLKKGGRIPSLRDLISSFPNLRFNIDIKTKKAVDKTVKIIKDQKALERVCLASFSSKRLTRIRKLAGPDCCTSMSQLEVIYLLVRSYGIPVQRSMGYCAQVPTSQWGIPIVTKKFVDYAHKENKFVHVWTIDKRQEMEDLIELGVDGLMTDRPSILFKVMKEKNLI